MQIVYESNSLCHYGVKGMKWGYTDGTRNGNRTANVNNYRDYPSEDDVPASVKKDRTDTRTIKIERTASSTTEYGNYGPDINTLQTDKKTGKKTYGNSKSGERVVQQYLEKKEKEVKHGGYMKIVYAPDSYLCHHGVKGMKWGHRKQRRAENSAARSYFREDRAQDFQTMKKANRKRNLREASLNESQVKTGRYRVARARSIKRNAASVTLGALTGAGAAAAIVATGGAAAPAIIAAVGASGISTLGAHFGTGAHYYGKQRKAYNKYKHNNPA